MATQFQIVRDMAARQGERIALISEDDGARTYGQLVDGAAKVAYALLNELGLEAGASLALWGVNKPDWVEVFLGCSAVGITCFLINPDWTVSEAVDVLRDSGVTVVVHDRNLGVRAAALQAQAPSIRHCVAMGDWGGLQLDRLKALAPDDSLERLPEVDHQAAPLFFTSGTTGRRSKAVIKAPGRSLSPVKLDELFNLGVDDRTIVVTPFFHSNGNSALMLTLSFGGSVVFQRRFSASGFWRLVDKYRPTFFFTLSAIVNILMARPPVSGEIKNSLKYILALGVSPYIEAVEARFGVRAIDWYGGTEIGGCAYTPIDEPHRPGAVGKLLPGVKLRILDENLSFCDPGVVGQIALPLNAIPFREYAGDPEATAAVIAGEWFLTGDMGYLDQDGWLYFVDRLKDIVRRGGENISSLEIEAVLQEHPAISEIAVVPRPDPLLGERVTAFVVPAIGHGIPTPKDLRLFAGRKLATFKVPDMIIPIDALPRTPTGKIRKAVLKRQLVDQARTDGETKDVDAVQAS